MRTNWLDRVVRHGVETIRTGGKSRGGWMPRQVGDLSMSLELLEEEQVKHRAQE